MKDYHIMSLDGKPLYDEQALAQAEDPEQGVMAEHYADLKASEVDLAETPVFKYQLYFIAIWQLSAGGVYNCLYTFNVPDAVFSLLDDSNYKL